MNKAVARVHHVDRSDSTSFDAVFVALGFEQRSTYVAAEGTVDGEFKHALGFEQQQVLSYQTNRDMLRDLGYSIHICADVAFRQTVQDILAEVQDECPPGRPVKLAIDVSSLTRLRLATLLDVLRFDPGVRETSLSFFYSLAKYDPPPENELPNRHVGPVTANFAGWTTDPDGPHTCIVGLGYERDRAVGAVEQLQSQNQWLFFPESPITEYHEAVEDTNDVLLGDIDPRHVLPYPVMDPLFTFVTLESLADRSRREGGCTIFPFGPKTFALAAMVVGMVHEDIAVWRVSPGILTPPADRVASGRVAALGVELRLTRGST